MSDCLFCRIVRGEIPSRKAYEDDDTLAFYDIHPKARVHLLVIPKKHIASLADAQPEDRDMLGKLMLLAPKLAAEHGLTRGFQTRVHTGPEGGQEVYHLHLHVLGGGPA